MQETGFELGGIAWAQIGQARPAIQKKLPFSRFLRSSIGKRFFVIAAGSKG